MRRQSLKFKRGGILHADQLGVQAPAARPDVGIVRHGHVFVPFRRLTGRIYLLFPRQGLRQCPDGQHRVAEPAPVYRRFSHSASLPDPAGRFRFRHSGGGTVPGTLPEPESPALAADDRSGRDPAPVQRGIFPAGAEPAGQRRRLVLLRHAGTDAR